MNTAYIPSDTIDDDTFEVAPESYQSETRDAARPVILVDEKDGPVPNDEEYVDGCEQCFEELTQGTYKGLKKVYWPRADFSYVWGQTLCSECADAAPLN